ncbi:MAG: hypothetical protein H0V73_05915 [Chloroflexi bacterium]|nr:hypothetical protein [Chloroflexota bacterium]
MVATIGVVIVGLGVAYHFITAQPRQSLGDHPVAMGTAAIEITTGTTSAILSAANMAPGDVVNAAFTITNSGSEAMAYGMRPGVVSAGGEALATALILTVRTVGSSCADFDGTVLFEGPLGTAAFGNDGDSRPLAGATADILCFRAGLPVDASDVLQGAGMSITLMFDGAAPAAVR